MPKRLGIDNSQRGFGVWGGGQVDGNLKEKGSEEGEATILGDDRLGILHFREIGPAGVKKKGRENQQVRRLLYLRRGKERR